MAPLSALLSALLCAGWAAQKPAPTHPLQEVRDHHQQGRYELVRKALEGPAISKLKRRFRAEAYRLLGESHERLGDMDRALRVYQLAEGLYPKDINLLSNLANLLHHIGLDERARPYYERVLRIHPNNAAAHLGLAEVSRAQGMTPEAADHYERALRELSGAADVWRDYAELLSECRRFEEAETAIRRSLELSRDSDALLDLALIGRRRGRSTQAAADLEEATRVAPFRTDLRLRLALWRIEDGRPQDALSLVSGVLSESPKDPLALWIRASIRLREGKTSSALEDLRVAASATRTHPFVAASAKKLLDLAAGATR